VDVKHASDATFYHLSKDICECHKISAKLNNVQNINILVFVHSLSLTGLKLCSWAR